MGNFNSKLHSVGLTLSLLFAVSSVPSVAIAQDDYPYLEALYKHLHQHPELSGQELETSKRMAAEMRAVGFDVTEGIGGYGVVGVMKNGDGPTLLLRADMDGLPVLEETGVPYASNAKGLTDEGDPVPTMHACGHDIHMTSLVGAARRLSAMRDKWQGTLVLVGQPAEERVDGAKRMLEEGLFERFPRPDYNVALHASASLPAGQVGVVSGYALANVDSVDIAIKGIGGHGAYPHTTKDPIVLASHIVVALQTLVSRETPSLDSAVVTVGSIHAGTKHNIISNKAHLEITVRSYEDDVRANLLSGIERIAHGQAQSFGLPEGLWPEVTFSEPVPSTYNDPAMTERLAAIMRQTLGDDRVQHVEPVMAAEDFSYFGRTNPKIPSVIFWLGAVPPEQVAKAEQEGLQLPSLHSSLFAPAYEPTIKTGVDALVGIAFDLLSSAK
ncbi:M20 metallopeptidase family protein [Kordiimonas aquimaris]|uniref:M20 metallopeptidase family protein n=1 Tax=Kordiimonas aquimaris TaxID=707591 RepID=UPI0021CE6248|nr:amidohydrolase [Kordiimonas aquimaris]